MIKKDVAFILRINCHTCLSVINIRTRLGVKYYGHFEQLQRALYYWNDTVTQKCCPCFHVEFIPSNYPINFSDVSVDKNANLKKREVHTEIDINSIFFKNWLRQYYKTIKSYQKKINKTSENAIQIIRD